MMVARRSRQFAIVRVSAAQAPSLTQFGERGIEADNNEFNNNSLPRSNPAIYNITMCGDPDRNEGGEGPRAANFRRGTAFTFRNFLVTGFKTTGLQISDATTTAQVTEGTTQLGAGVAWGMPTNLHSSVMTFVTSGRFPNVRVGATDAEVGISTAGCANHESPQFQPGGVATLAGGQMAPIQPPNDGFFEAVTFIGAVPPAPADNWMSGWTSFPQR